MKTIMFSLHKLFFALTLGLTLGQRSSLWKKYSNIPGTLNCRVDADIVNRATSDALEHFCVARIANNTDFYPGALVVNEAHKIYFDGLTRSGDWFGESNLEDVEVLDVDPSLLSWIPIDLNPSQSLLIQPETPYSSEPKRFICRSPPHLLTSHKNISVIVQLLGVMRDKICYTRGGQLKYEFRFEVLALNERAKVFYDYVPFRSLNETQF